MASFAYFQKSFVFGMGGLMSRSQYLRAQLGSRRLIQIAHFSFRLESTHKAGAICGCLI
jgi:hypothetical protein